MWNTTQLPDEADIVRIVGNRHGGVIPPIKRALHYRRRYVDIDPLLPAYFSLPCLRQRLANILVPKTMAQVQPYSLHRQVRLVMPFWSSCACHRIAFVGRGKAVNSLEEIRAAGEVPSGVGTKPVEVHFVGQADSFERTLKVREVDEDFQPRKRRCHYGRRGGDGGSRRDR